MIRLFFIFFSLIISSCYEYEELSWHYFLNVIPDAHVYLDISSYSPGDTISFEIYMDLFFASDAEKKCYRFQIDQVPAQGYNDYDYWDNLRQVYNKNVSCTGYFDDHCTFKWKEIKKKGNNYIFIILPAPYDGYYSFAKNKIRIENLGLSIGGIIGIIIACIAFIGIILFIIIYRKKCRKSLNLGTVVPNINNSLPNSQPSVPTCEPPNEQIIDYKEPLYPSPFIN